MAGTATLRSEPTTTGTRTYGHAEPLALALDVLGDRWTMLVVRELLLGPQRFTDLSTTLPRMGRNLLAARLEQLTAARLVEPVRLPWTSGRSRPYALTRRGLELESPLLALARIGLDDVAPAVGEARPGWAAFALAAASVSPPRRASIEVSIDGERFVIQARPGAHALARRTIATPPGIAARVSCTTRAALRVASRGTAPQRLAPLIDILGIRPAAT